MIDDTVKSDTTGTVPGPKAVRRRVASWVLIVVVAAGVVAGIVVTSQQNARAQAEQDATESTAWENRLVMDQVLVDTMAYLEMDGEVQDVRDAPFSCTRNDGRDGSSYGLHEIYADAVDDPDALLTTIGQYWESLGYTTGRGRIGDAQMLFGDAPEGATVQALSGPGGTILAGETGCALIDGGPDS